MVLVPLHEFIYLSRPLSATHSIKELLENRAVVDELSSAFDNFTRDCQMYVPLVSAFGKGLDIQNYVSTKPQPVVSVLNVDRGECDDKTFDG
jgi:hypothetical protein